MADVTRGGSVFHDRLPGFPRRPPPKRHAYQIESRTIAITTSVWRPNRHHEARVGRMTELPHPEDTPLRSATRGKGAEPTRATARNARKGPLRAEKSTSAIGNIWDIHAGDLDPLRRPAVQPVKQMSVQTVKEIVNTLAAIQPQAPLIESRPSEEEEEVTDTDEQSHFQPGNARRVKRVVHRSLDEDDHTVVSVPESEDHDEIESSRQSFDPPRIPGDRSARKRWKTQGQRHRVKGARKGTYEVSMTPESSPELRPRLQLATRSTKSARKRDVTTEEMAELFGADNDENQGTAGSWPINLPSDHESSDDSLESYVSETSPATLDIASESRPSSKVLLALESLILPTLRMQRLHSLPFQLRNLRRGFLSRNRHLATVSSSPDQREVHVIYRVGSEDSLTLVADDSVYGARMDVSNGWCCPFCDLLGLLPIREMLAEHLKTGHPEVNVKWHQAADLTFEYSWKLFLDISPPLHRGTYEAVQISKRQHAKLHTFLLEPRTQYMPVQMDMDSTLAPPIGFPQPSTLRTWTLPDPTEDTPAPAPMELSAQSGIQESLDSDSAIFTRKLSSADSGAIGPTPMATNLELSRKSHPLKVPTKRAMMAPPLPLQPNRESFVPSSVSPEPFKREESSIRAPYTPQLEHASMSRSSSAPISVIDSRASPALGYTSDALYNSAQSHFTREASAASTIKTGDTVTSTANESLIFTDSRTPTTEGATTSSRRRKSRMKFKQLRPLLRPDYSVKLGRPDHPVTKHPFLDPPPPDKLRGPAAQEPYLPTKPEYDAYAPGVRVEYSVRPGGPRLFDLLDLLPLDEFGLLEWLIIDKEEEIAEYDMLEEDKVILALWIRWISVRERKLHFISNYVENTKRFVTEYWWIIHLAAGWDALRLLLLTLFSNRYLTSDNIANVLMHYEDMVGMKYWYPNAVAVRTD